MKVVINKCYGGFGLSHKAILAMVGKCEHIELIDPKKYYGKDYERRFKQEYPNGVATEFAYSPLYEGKLADDSHNGNRDCPILVKTVEEMGASSWDSYAKLKIVEIPDGTSYKIVEYDGSEHIAETHNTWS